MYLLAGGFDLVRRPSSHAHARGEHAAPGWADLHLRLSIHPRTHQSDLGKWRILLGENYRLLNCVLGICFFLFWAEECKEKNIDERRALEIFNRFANFQTRGVVRMNEMVEFSRTERRHALSLDMIHYHLHADTPKFEKLHVWFSGKMDKRIWRI